MSEISEQVQELLNNPEKILQKKPFFEVMIHRVYVTIY